MSFYFFNRHEILQKAKNKYRNCGGKEKAKAAKYYISNKEFFLKSAKNNYRNLSEKENEQKREYRKNRYRNMTRNEKIGSKSINFFYIM